MLAASLSPRRAARDGANATFTAQLGLVILTAIAVGAADAALVVFGIAGAAGAFQFVPARIWVIAPLTWMALAILMSAAVLPWTRRRAGESLSAALLFTFLAIRLRAHPFLLFIALAIVGTLTAFISRSIRRWLARPRRSITAATVALLAGCAVFTAAESPTVAPTDARAASTDPNVIVIFLDTVRYDALFDPEGQVRGGMPTLTRLRGESTVFTHAYAPSPWTLPSHLSAVTGLAAHELGVSFDSQVYTRSEPTLAERFRQRGYRTAAVISNSFLNAGSGFARGFDIFEQAQAALDVCRTGPGLLADMHVRWFAAAVCNWTASEVTRRARTLLNDEDRPFFLTVNYMDAHDPYYVERGCGGDHGYGAAIRCLDRNLAPIVDWRSSRRFTVLAIVGDHGELFGEHGLVRHGNSLYVQLLHVPLMIRSARQQEPRTSAEPISIAALGTLLDDADARVAKGPVLALLHPPADAGLPSEWAALDGPWHLIVRERGSEALYHLESDPAEEHNLISTSSSDPAVARLRSAIAAMRRTPRPELKKFRAIGYLH